MKARLFAVAAVATVAGMTAGPASAHTLSATTAKQEARKAGATLLGSVGGARNYSCARRNAHAIDCQISVVALDGSACVANVRVQYASHRARKPSRRVLSGPDCTPPELVGGLPPLLP